jgi:uncharacterized membrane-anchored protein
MVGAMGLFKRSSAVVDDNVINGSARLIDAESGVEGVRAGDVVVAHVALLGPEAVERLIETEVAAVLIVQAGDEPSVRAVGPGLLVAAGVHVVGGFSDELTDALRSGDRILIDRESVYLGKQRVATGVLHSSAAAADDVRRNTAALANRFDSIATNATERLRQERDMLFEGARVPVLDLPIKGRIAVVVSDEYQVESDLKSIRRFVRDNDVVLVGVGSAADLMIKLRMKPDIIVGRSAELSAKGISVARAIIVITPDGKFDDSARYETEGTEVHTFAATGASEDLATILVDTAGAEVIIMAGSPPRLADLFERDTADVSSMFVTRLRAGTKVVDAKVVGHFMRQRISWLWPLLLLVSSLIALAVAIGFSPWATAWLVQSTPLNDLWTWIEGLFS